ncbi:FAD:protein FMN transferase [Salicola sp. Rm-C-2C1-2]|uniref:FAD:protein FMN transferase n=1 Tax=Salicola sp. Rm-C-2C1-2 TaxID=3141321 RepID=UPI0032E36D00
MPSSTMRLSVCILALLLPLLLLSACGDANEPDSREIPVTHLEGRIFGTFYRVSVAETLAQSRKETLHEAVRGTLQNVDLSMSTYRDDSDLMRLNNHPPGKWVELPEGVIDVVSTAERLSERTDGAFDATIGDLVNLWSFGPEARPTEVPSDAAIEARLKRVGHANLELDSDNNRARRMTDLFVDLSAIAKGEAVDRVARLLKERGYPNHLVNIGGDLKASGRKAESSPWRIGIEVPRDGPQSAHHVLPLSDMSLATSGDYRNYFEVDGQRYSHTIDPRDGRPVTHSLASASVFHPSNRMADALATAFMVMGVEATLDYARNHGIAVLVIEHAQQRFRTRISPALEQMLSEEDLAALKTD